MSHVGGVGFVLQAQIEKLVEKDGFESISTVVKSLPENITLTSACTGTGSFELATRAVIEEINQHFQTEMHAPWQDKIRVTGTVVTVVYSL